MWPLCFRFCRLSVSSSDRRTMSFERKWKRIIISGIETWNSWGDAFPFSCSLAGLCDASVGAESLLFEIRTAHLCSCDVSLARNFDDLDSLDLLISLQYISCNSILLADSVMDFDRWQSFHFRWSIIPVLSVAVLAPRGYYRVFPEDILNL